MERSTIEAKKRALIISVSKYNSDRLQQLGFCKNDGQDTYDLLKKLGYEMVDNQKLIGHVTYESMRKAIMDFFTDVNNKADDTLLFYYSGHGIPDVDGDIYLASSEIDPDAPFRSGYSFNDLTKMTQRSVSIRIVTILDCCYSGKAKVGSKGHELISKGDEEAAATLGRDAMQTVPQQGEGKCLLAASQAAQEAYALKEGDHSIFTYYLLQGLRGNEDSVEADGNVTPHSLGKYIFKSIMNLPPDKRPKQKPITKTELSGDIILASYPPTTRKSKVVEPTRPKNKILIILISIIGVLVIGAVIAFTFLGPIIPTPDTQTFTPPPEDRASIKQLPSTPQPPSSVDNHIPRAIDQYVKTYMDTPKNIILKGSDQDTNDDLTPRIESGPFEGTLNQNRDVVTYTPGDGFVGTDKFTFKVNDGKEDSSNAGTVEVTVEPKADKELCEIFDSCK
jgi:hypothetical protein